MVNEAVGLAPILAHRRRICLSRTHVNVLSDILKEKELYDEQLWT